MIFKTLLSPSHKSSKPESPDLTSPSLPPWVVCDKTIIEWFLGTHWKIFCSNLQYKLRDLKAARGLYLIENSCKILFNSLYAKKSFNNGIMHNHQRTLWIVYTTIVWPCDRGKSTPQPFDLETVQKVYTATVWPRDHNHSIFDIPLLLHNI